MRRLAAQLGGALCLLLACAMSGGEAEAQDPAASADSVAGVARERCRQRADSLAAYRGRLIQRAESLAELQIAAEARGDTDAVGRLLAQGESLADTIRAVSAGYLAQRLICQRLGGTLPLRADFPLPLAEETDPPMILRQKAGYARDLVDRIDRWLETIALERARLAELRLAEEARRLVLDRSLLDEQAALDIGGAGTLGILEEHPEAPGLLALLMREMPGMAEAERPEDVLHALAEWLTARRVALLGRAEELDGEAVRRENEP